MGILTKKDKEREGERERTSKSLLSCYKVILDINSSLINLASFFFLGFSMNHSMKVSRKIWIEKRNIS